ncbi:LamG-like jellyroll fold domain-containing protein [Crossiella sp. CA198]|uniref:LamG-like jellyroll fold domain-containing protein n=1 Tax=Crossiella sp. CA198 TaxID=3455607 RepID=UPI003F8D0983
MLSVLVAALVASVVSSAPPEQARPPADTPVAAAPDAATAIAAAVRQNSPVEVLSERTGTRTVLAHPDGRHTAKLTAQPTRFQRDGDWVPIDRTLRTRPDGTIAPRAAGDDVALSGGGTAPLLRLAEGENLLALHWPEKLPAPRLAGNEATYPEVLPGVDLIMRAETQGYQQLVVIKTAAAARNPALARIALRAETSGVTLTAEDSGALRAVDRAGRPVFSAAPSVMWDAGRARSAPVGVEVAKGVLTLVPDQRFLADPATVYPVTVDPTVTPFHKSQWATTLSGKPGTTYWGKSADPVHPDWAQVGQCYNAHGDCHGIGEAWAYFQFETGFLSGKNVHWARFYTQAAHSPNCNTHTHVLRHFHHGINGDIRWDNRPVGPVWTEFGSPPGVGCAGHRGVELDVAGALNRGGTTTFSLQAHNGGAQEAWRKYYSGNTWVEVEWNRTPHNPTGLRTDPPLPQPCRWCAGVPHIGDATLRMIAEVADPDQDQVRASWRAQVQGRPLWTKDAEDFKPSGVSHDWVLNLNNEHGRSVAWWVHGVDRATGGGASHGQSFAVDRVGITARPEVRSAAYPEDNDWHGGVGVPGSFTFAPGAACDAQNTHGVCDIDHYRYSWTNPPSAESKVNADALGGPATALLAPPGDGPRTLYVQSVDRAGHASPVKEHRVYVRPGTGPLAKWSMEGNVNDTAFLGDRHGSTQGNVTYAPGAVGSAMVGDGAPGTQVTAPNTVRTDSGFSLSAWVKLAQADGARRTILRQDGAAQAGFALRYDGDTRSWVIAFAQEDSARPDQEWYFVRSSGEPVAGTWTHLAATYDAGSRQIALYVDGVLAGTAQRRVAWHASGQVRIGPDWNGALDEVALYDRVLSAAEVSAEVRRDNVQTGYWRLDDKDGRTAANSAEGGEAGILHGDARFSDGGAVNRAVRLDGDGDHVATSRPAVRTDRGFSVAAWVKADRFVTGGTSMTAVSQDGDRHSGFYLQYNSEHNGWLFTRFVADQDEMPPVAWIGLKAKQKPVAGVWTHLAATFNATDRKMTIFVNGEHGGELTLPTAPWHAGGPLVIGRGKFKGNPVDHWPGAVDEVRTYSRALSAAELEGIVTRNQVLAGSWKLNGDLTDDSPNGKNGEAKGNPAWTAGQASIPDPADMAISLDGVDDHVRTAPVVDTTQSYSVSAWVRLTERQSGWHAVASQAGAKVPAFTMGYSGSDANPPHRWVAQINGPDVNNPRTTRATSDTQAQTGVWTHLAAVYRAGTGELTLYVNGAQSAYAKLTDQPTFNAQAAFEIGRGMWNGGFGEFFRGAVDDVKAHSRALFAEEIRVMAGRDPALVHHWRFDEGGGGTAADSVGARPATLSGAVHGPGRVGNAIRFDGQDDVASTTGVDLRTDNAFTVSAWVNLDKPGPCAGVCAMTAVSADGGRSSGSSKFRLGHRIDNDQAPEGKWVFELPERDGTVTEAAISVRPSQFNTWVQLIGVYDARAGQVWLYVHAGGEEADIDDGTLLSPWQAEDGVLRIGRGQREGAAAGHWRGSVDDVRLYATGLEAERITALHRSYAASAAAPELPVAGGGHWRFNENGGSTAVDASDRAQPATLRGGASRASGRENLGLRLDGTSGFAETATPVVNTTGSFSLSAWAQVSRNSGDHQTVVAQDGATQSTFLLQYQPSTGRWTFEVPVEGKDSIVVWSAEPGLTGLWTHVAVTYDAVLKQARFYLNGMVSSVHVGLSIPESTGKFTIGRGKRKGGDIDFFAGNLDDVRVFDRKALTEGEVRRLHDDVPIQNHGTWSFEGTVADTSPRAEPTTVSGGTRYEPGIRGQALWLDGRTGAAATQQISVNMLDSFTVSAWANLSGTGADATILGQDGARMSGFLLQYNKDLGRWVFGAAKQDADLEQLVHAHSPRAPEPNTWTHLTGVYDNAARELRLYVNGELVDVQDNAPLWPAWGAFTLGRGKVNGQSAGHFAGLLDEVRTDLGIVPAQEIAQRAAQPPPAGGQLARFVNASGQRSTANSAGTPADPFTPVPAGHRFERPLGRLLTAGQPETRLLRTCRTGTEEFTSADPACGGGTTVADLGWAYQTPPETVPTVALYRCVTGTDRFDSLDPGCEGGTQQELLGHTVAHAPLATYRHTQDEELTTTIFGVPPGYRPAGTPGLVLLTEAAGTRPLWACRKGLDAYVSADTACGGDTQTGPAGRVWTEPRPGSSSTPLYLCQTARGERFNSTDPDCAAAGTPPAVLLGHLLTTGTRADGR